MHGGQRTQFHADVHGRAIEKEQSWEGPLEKLQHGGHVASGVWAGREGLIVAGWGKAQQGLPSNVFWGQQRGRTKQTSEDAWEGGLVVQPPSSVSQS